MNRDDIQKLLGGYATDTLTPEEQQTLFEAALSDQELFDALAREQALRDLLRDPGAKAQLLAVLDDRPLRWYQRLVQGWRPFAAVAVMAGACVIAVVVWRNAHAPQPVLVAQVSPSEQPQLGQQSPAAQSTARPLDEPSGRFAKENVAKPTADQQGAFVDDRRAKLKQAETRSDSGSASKNKEVADAIDKTKTPTSARAEPGPPPGARAFTSGLREGAAAGKGGGGAGGYLSAPTGPAQPVPASPGVGLIAGFRDGETGAKRGVVGGLAPAGTPASPQVLPPPPPPATLATVPAPKAEAPQQGAQSAAGVQSQLERAQQAPAPRFQQAQGQQGIANSQSVSVNGQPLNAPLNSNSQLNAQSLFYGIAEEAKDANAVAEQLLINGSTQKKVAKQAENEKAQRQTTEVTVTGAVPGKSIPPHVANPGVRYSLRRKTGNGKFQQVDPGDLKTGDTLELEIIPNDSGVLSVSGRGSNGGWRQILSRRVERLKTVITRLKAGEKELLVSFKRQPVAMTAAGLFDEKSRANVTQSTAEPATYVVGDPASQQVDFTITLVYK